MEKKCPNCGASNHFTESKCIDCGFVFNAPQINESNFNHLEEHHKPTGYADSIQKMLGAMDTLFILTVLFILIPSILNLIFNFGWVSFGVLIGAILFIGILSLFVYIYRMLFDSYRVVVEASELYLKNNQNESK